MDAKVTWRDGLAFTGTANTGFEVTLDAAPGVGGSDTGPRPMELIALGLVGCTGMDVISILRKKRQHVTGFEVKAHLEQADEHPHVFTSARIEYIIRGHDVDPAAVERAIELSETRYCPAQAMLGQVMPIDLDYTIVAEESG